VLFIILYHNFSAKTTTKLNKIGADKILYYVLSI